MWKLLQKQILPEPKLEEPPKIEQIVELIEYFRSLHSADENFGYNACEKVNRGLVNFVHEKYPNIEVRSLFCSAYKGITRSPNNIVEHFAGAIFTKEGWIWFDGTGDQLSIPQILRK